MLTECEGEKWLQEAEHYTVSKMEAITYEFVGGSRDGEKIRIGGTPYVGSTFPGASLPGRKREIYVLHADGKYHFDRLGLEFNPRAEMPDVLEELSPIFEKLRAAFSEMDVILEKYGGPSAGSTTLGNWTFKHKEA